MREKRMNEKHFKSLKYNKIWQIREGLQYILDFNIYMKFYIYFK